MSACEMFGDVAVRRAGADFVAEVELRRPPNNFFDRALIASLADAFESLDADDGCRAIVLTAAGKNFCAGANFAEGDPLQGGGARRLYDEAVRLFATQTPVVAAVHGAAIGGGLGLALMPDFRVAAPEARFSANFARLGLHQGFGISVTLPRLIGTQRAAELLYTGRRIGGEEAHALGLCDRLVPRAKVREVARALAAEIATSAPLAVRSIRATLRAGLSEEVRRATEREAREQERLRETADFAEGVRATAARRAPVFTGK